MRKSYQSIAKAAAAVVVLVAMILSVPIADAQTRPRPGGERPRALTHQMRPPAPAWIYRAPIPRFLAERRRLNLGVPGGRPVFFPQLAPLRLVEGRPSAAAIEAARQRNGLPPTARAVGWRLIDGAGGKVWKIIFRVGNRQVAVEMPAGG